MTRALPELQRGDAAERPVLAIVVTFVLGVFIGLVTLLPSPPQVPSLFNPSDKASHAIAFAAFILPTALFAMSILSRVLAAALLYGGAIEVIQPQVGRSAEFGDMVANMAGLAAGLALAWGLRRLYAGWVKRSAGS